MHLAVLSSWYLYVAMNSMRRRVLEPLMLPLSIPGPEAMDIDGDAGDAEDDGRPIFGFRDGQPLDVRPPLQAIAFEIHRMPDQVVIDDRCSSSASSDDSDGDL
jgi:hypothetical protein